MGIAWLPGVPVASNGNLIETAIGLRGREGEFRPAVDGLSVSYTIGGHTESAKHFLYGIEYLAYRDDRLRNLPLESPEQFAISWTTYKDVYKHAMSSLQPSVDPFGNGETVVTQEKPLYWDSLTSVEAATESFWDMFASHGTAFNLLMLRRVTDARLPQLKRLFDPLRWGVIDNLDSIQRGGRLYEIDLKILSCSTYRSEGKAPRFNPRTVTLLERDSKQTGRLAPRVIWVSNENGKEEVYSKESPAWLYALQAAKSSITIYGIWLGHVYQWHMVTAAMQETMFHAIDQSHSIFKLLGPQSRYLIGFDYALFNKTQLMGDLFSQIAPPSGFGNPRIVLELMDTFAVSRNFFDDDPKTQLARNGLEEADFTLEKPWDQYPTVRHLLRIWDICERYVAAFVGETYADDSAVASDAALQTWIAESRDPNQGNIRGLPVMNSRIALASVLTSLVYRVTAHGVARLPRTANPELSWVANFPPCLQRDDIPPPTTRLTTKQLLTYLPNTGTIGEMLSFYFAFSFSESYQPLLPENWPSGNPDADLYFGERSDPRNIALRQYRNDMKQFMLTEYQWWQTGDFSADVKQWPRGIET
jgi:hypothetical protein